MRHYIINKKWSLGMMLMVALLQLTFTSCKDDSDDGGQPVITAVRVPDPAKADSTFTKAGPGSVIAIMGQNLGSALKVYINNQSVYFNPTLNTDHSIIVQIPSETDGFKLSAFDSSIPDEIRVETTHGTAVYSFKITAPGPQLTRIQGTYPRHAGDILNVYGKNLVDIEKIYFTDVTAARLDTTEWTTPGGNHVDVASYNDVTQDHHLNTTTNSYETTSVLQLTTPDLPFDEGTLVLECASGIVYIPYTKVPGQPVILGVSTDMPVIGETVSISGREFVQIESITYGDVTLSPNDFTIAESEDGIEFTFTKKPSETSNPVLTITTPGGKASVSFYDYSCLLVDFDGRGQDNGWDPKATVETAASTAAPFSGDGNFAHIYHEQIGQSWWGTMVYWRGGWDAGGNAIAFDLPSYDVIPANASTDDIYIAVEVFNNNSSFNNGSFMGYFRYFIQSDNEDPVPVTDDAGNLNPEDQVNQYDNGFSWENYDEEEGGFERPVLANINDLAPTGMWYRHVIKLSSFLKYKGKTYQDVVNGKISQLRIQYINQGARVQGTVDVFFDNIRLYYNKK